MAPDCGSNITGPASNTIQRFFVTNIITFTFLLLYLVPLRVQLVDKLHKLLILKFFTSVFTMIHHVWELIIGLYRVAHLCRQLYAPVQKCTRNNPELNHRPTQMAPPMDEYTIGLQIRPTLLLDDNSPLLAPLMTEESTLKAVFQPPKLPKSVEDKALDSETPVSQVTLLLGITPRENHQLQHKNTPDNILDILGTCIYQGYVETPIQTLGGIMLNQPKRFLPLVEEVKCLTEEISIEKLNEQWSGIPHEQLLNQSFTDQLNSIQILEQLVLLQLTKQHLPADIIDILECLGKVDNIPFNQLYYIAENCANHYYSKVIETFVSILKCQFANHQLLLVNTAHSLKFLEEYTDCQSQIWKIFQKHQTIPEDFQDLHLHFDDFKNSIEKDFKFLKEATSRNVENFQSSLSLQQTYSASLCSYINNIYNKLAELQRQIQHSDPHMNSGDTIQIEAPDFDPHIDDNAAPTTDEISNKVLTQGTALPTPKTTELETECSTPAMPIQQTASQDTDWPDAIPVEIPPQIDQPEDEEIDGQQTQSNSNRAKIPDLEENSEEEQYADLDSYLAHHNTYEASRYIHHQYRSHLHTLDDEMYYEEIDKLYDSYGTLAAQDYRLANQVPGPHRTTEELTWIFGKGRGQTHREELHGHRSFGSRMRLLQSRIQRKIKKNQRLCHCSIIFMS